MSKGHTIRIRVSDEEKVAFDRARGERGLSEWARGLMWADVKGPGGVSVGPDLPKKVESVSVPPPVSAAPVVAPVRPGVKLTVKAEGSGELCKSRSLSRSEPTTLSGIGSAYGKIL